ncbi:transposable element Tcb2 transposase [Trichonephila clavipes]|nr:transposable element Tcb2 transposase [Trichonephila clavipes]
MPTLSRRQRSIHTAKIVQEWFAEHEGEVGHLDWPPQSPDLNIIEHLWGYLESKLRARFPPPSTISALEAALHEEWLHIPLQVVHDLYASIPRHIQSVIPSKGVQLPINKAFLLFHRKDLIDELKIFGMSSRHFIDDFMHGRIIGKIEEGRKITDVAREFDIAHSVVSRLWKSFKTTGMCSRRHGGGRVRRKQISRKTVARPLRGGGIYASIPVVRVPLTRQQRTARLQWCREHRNWTEQDWACVLFSDESKFSLSSDCRRQLIWRESGTAYCPENIQ